MKQKTLVFFFKKKGTQIGFFAHELKDAFPELDNISVNTIDIYRKKLFN